ncbi:MAG: sigma-70 family RNA polymerase sigma factor [Pseudomonadota bacterium]
MTERECDQLLVARFQSGETGAFDLLVARHQHRLMRMISRIVRNPQEAEDMVQETFINAYRGMRLFRGEAAFRTWLYRIGINAAKNCMAAQRQRLATESDAGIDPDGVVAEQLRDLNTPESLLATKQLAAILEQALAALPLDLRSALVLREIEGCGYEEISAIMACPIGTVRSRIFRARDLIADKLRPMLENQGEGRW